jgi:hypothetical protein
LVYKPQNRKSSSSFTFQTMTKVSRAIEGKRSLPGISQAISKGMASLTIRSRIGMLSRCLIKGFSSERPRYIARTVKERSSWFRRIKEAFSTVHCLNVAAEPHRLDVIPVLIRPVRRH